MDEESKQWHCMNCGKLCDTYLCGACDMNDIDNMYDDEEYYKIMHEKTND